MAAPEQVRVGGYRILRKLAVGGMAEIFLAQLEAGHGFTKQVVIKRMLPHLCEDPRFIEMFLHEARLAAHLNHPNVAQVFDIGEREGRPHYAMEYVNGPDLRAVARRMHASGEGPRLDLVLGICIGAAAGLHHAHTARDEHGRPLAIVHRDVTPSNVVVTYSGVAKLLDFGVAKTSLEGRESTGAGILKGKIPYMSPEQIDTSVRLDGRSDVFSLGVVLWELTTLHRLYRGASQIETVRKIIDEDAPPPSSVVEGYPAQLEAIVMRALARDREQRWPDAAALQRALEEFAAEQRLVVSASRIAEHMGELFAAEIAAEEARGDDAPTRLYSGASSSLPRPRVTTDVASGPTELEPSVDSLAPLPSPGEQPPARRGPPPWAMAVGAVGLVVAGLLLAFDLGRSSGGPEQPVPAAPAAAFGEAPQPGPGAELEQEPEPEPESEPEPAAEPEQQPGPEPASELAPSRPRKKTASKRKKTSKTEAERDWNKNSLALPK